VPAPVSAKAARLTAAAKPIMLSRALTTLRMLMAGHDKDARREEAFNLSNNHH
jgi:hypothetical protein